jgi:hypothetical protein
MASQRVTMLRLTRGERASAAVAELDAALPDAEVTPPDDLGVFEIALDSTDREGALERVWDAVAAAGVDDHVVFLEHPDLPEHWQHRSGSPQP